MQQVSFVDSLLMSSSIISTKTEVIPARPNSTGICENDVPMTNPKSWEVKYEPDIQDFANERPNSNAKR